MNSTPNPNTLKYGFFALRRAKKHKFSNLPFVRAHYTIRKTRKPLKSVLQIPSNLPFVRAPYTIRKTRNLQNERRRGLKKKSKCILEHQIFYKILWKVVYASQKTSVFLHLLIRFTNLKMLKIWCSKIHFVWVFARSRRKIFRHLSARKCNFYRGLKGTKLFACGAKMW